MAALVPAKPNFSSRFLGHKLAIHESRSSPKTCEFSISNLKTCGLRLRSPICCAANTPLEGSNVKFPRIRVGDPYKRLGISNYASVEEIWGARNFLLQQYAQHERSAESIEDAFEKLLMKSFKERKKEKVNLKSRLKEKVEESPSWIKNLVGFVEVPAPVIIFRRLFLFSVLAGWSIMNAAEAGPALQVAVALGSCIYFLYDKTKSLGRAAGFGFGSLVVGWICGSLLGPSIAAAAILPVTWTLELTTSIVAFVFMFLGCTFLK